MLKTQRNLQTVEPQSELSKIFGFKVIIQKLEIQYISNNHSEYKTKMRQFIKLSENINYM